MTETVRQRKKLIDILAQVSQETGVDVSDIVGPIRRALFVKARLFFARLARAEGYVLRDIGEALGGRAHSTILEYFQDETKTKDQGGKDVNREEAKEKVKKFNKADRKELVAAIAETSDRGERDELAAFFSEAEKVAAAPAVETGGARREAPEPVQPVKEKKKNWLDLDSMA